MFDTIDDMVLTDNDRKEQLSIAFVNAVAAKSGYTVGSMNLDRESIDRLISAGGDMAPMLSVQLKATASPTWRGDTLAFSLPRKNYDDLRKVRFIPAILVVLELPENEEEWMHWTEGELIMRRCARWLSLKDFPAVETESKTVYLPRSQSFNPESLTELMKLAAEGSL